MDSFDVNKKLKAVGIRCKFSRTTKLYIYKTQLLDVAVGDVLVVQVFNDFTLVIVKEVVGELTRENLKFLDGIGYDNANWAFQRVNKEIIKDLNNIEKEVSNVVDRKHL